MFRPPCVSLIALDEASPDSPPTIRILAATIDLFMTFLLK
jgi:hypothetical protein